ncbi:MAG: hypothetical protein ACRC9V_15730, partial [Aeromonas sp.]
KALKQLDERKLDPVIMLELHTAADLALRATKVTARTLSPTMYLHQTMHLHPSTAALRHAVTVEPH